MFDKFFDRVKDVAIVGVIAAFLAIAGVFALTVAAAWQLSLWLTWPAALAVTVGALSSAFAVGVIVSSVLSGRLGGVRWHGLAIRNAIMGFGASIVGFGLVLLLAGTSTHGVNLPALVAASLCLVAAGAADNISAVFRTTMMQAAVPDGMRGRTQGIFIVVVTGGPRLGDAYIGIVAATALLWLPSLLGGVLIVVLAFVLVQTHRSFRHYDALNPTP